MIETSEQINELAAALAAAQGMIEHAKKDSVNPHLLNKYADLASVWDACRIPLAKNGLSVIQIPAGIEIMEIPVTKKAAATDPKKPDAAPADEAQVIKAVPCQVLVTRLTHTSGQWIQSVTKMPIVQFTAQGIGSALTYARRYSLAAMVGIAQDDDDGNEASGVTGLKQGQQQQHQLQKTYNAGQQQLAAQQNQGQQSAQPAANFSNNAGQQPAKSPISVILELRTKLNMTNDDLQFATKEIVGADTLKGRTEAEYRKLILALEEMVEKGISWSEWRAQREKDNAILTNSVQGTLPEFPA